MKKKKIVLVALLLVGLVLVLTSFAGRGAFHRSSEPPEILMAETCHKFYPSPWYGPDASEKKVRLDLEYSLYCSVGRDR